MSVFQFKLPTDFTYIAEHHTKRVEEEMATAAVVMERANPSRCSIRPKSDSTVWQSHQNPYNYVVETVASSGRDFKKQKRKKGNL